MIHSMTGYGRLNETNEKFDVNIELKSLNSKFLDIFVNFAVFILEQLAHSVAGLSGCTWQVEPTKWTSVAFTLLTATR